MFCPTLSTKGLIHLTTLLNLIVEAVLSYHLSAKFNKANVQTPFASEIAYVAFSLCLEACIPRMILAICNSTQSTSNDYKDVVATVISYWFGLHPHATLSAAWEQKLTCHSTSAIMLNSDVSVGASLLLPPFVLGGSQPTTMPHHCILSHYTWGQGELQSNSGYTSLFPSIHTPHSYEVPTQQLHLVVVLPLPKILAFTTTSSPSKAFRCSLPRQLPPSSYRITLSPKPPGPLLASPGMIHIERIPFLKQ